MTTPPNPTPGFDILIVDDDALQLTQLRLHLMARGHRVTEARNGAEAILLLQHHHPDLVLSDCLMPILDGYQLCRLIKDDRTTRHIPVVLLTSEATHLSSFWARVCGAERFLHKTPDFERLIMDALRVVRTEPRPVSGPPPVTLPLEALGVDSIQRRLSLALEHRLLETSLRDAVEKLYTMSGDTPELVGQFLTLIQDLVLPGAALVIFHDDRNLLGKGVRGRAAPVAECQELERAALRLLGTSEMPPCQWTQAPPTDHPLPTATTRIALPLAFPHAPPYGCLAVCVDQRIDPAFERLLEVAAQELGRLLSLEEARIKLYRMAVEDSLTGLPNRRQINDLVSRESELSTRYGHPFSVLLLDVDNFKMVNDTLGHQAGDEVLLQVTRCVKGILRKTDVLGRWGGDEFLVICPHADAGQVRLLAERLRAGVASMPVAGLEQPGLLGLSVGAASWRGAEDHPDELFRRADTRLYAAKVETRKTTRMGVDTP